MAPTPQEVTHDQMSPKIVRPADGEEVVISGMSGIFPMSDSVEEFSKNLYNKVNMVTTDNPRWVFDHPEMPKHLGKVKGMGKFDAQFFRVHYKQAATMEPMSRKLLEHAYSAIYDSGINPLQLRGKKVGVFIGSTFSESEKIVIYENVQRNGFGITGCNKAMYANRISYWIDGKGPSYSLDLACSSSMACLEHAYRSISSGQCDAAIVGGCNLCMHPNVSLNFMRAGFLSNDGKTKCFDKNGDGYVRSDAISVLFLQRAKDAKRIYSEVYHAKCSYSPSSKQLISVREPQELQNIFEEFYSEIDVSPKDVEYIEANGSALKEADSNELMAIGKVFGTEKPVKIGCVKSNMGSSEPASGVCGLTKVCLAYHNGEIPGNLHYNEPLDVPEVTEDKVQVLTDTVPFKRGFAALNSFSYGGANVHVLLKGHFKEKDLTRYNSSIPHLILLSGRQDNCIKSLIDTLKSKPVDPEEIGLLNGIHQFDISGHMSRGYTILDKNVDNDTICLSEHIEYYPGITRPIWFVYSGMGSQWTSMGTELMRIPIFAAAIQKCHRVLEPKGIDIVRILTDPDKTIYDNILNSFVGIAAVQIGLTDILTHLGIVPDNIIGHSVGELGCAYADGCFTAEEMILSAYSRGLVSVQTSFIRGSMAAVGLGYKSILPLLPPGIEVACHNSADSATISGPADVMKEFVSKLTAEGIFAKEVPCSNIAYHSKYIAGAGPALLKYLSEVIQAPKLRSKKWVSTSVPEEKWDEPIAKYSSAEYHTNNLLNPVLFEETSKLIPSDALVIEVAPHGLLQAILKRSLSECIHVPLTRRGTSDPVKFLLEAVGKLYGAGLNPKVDVLYPKIEYPVSTGTPLLSQYVVWEHSEDWSEAKYNNKDRRMTMIRNFVMTIHDDDHSYLEGHVRNGNYIFPESASLQLIWEILAMSRGVNYKNMSVMFEDVHFHEEVIILPTAPLRLKIMIFKGSNRFEINHADSIIVSGFVTKMMQNNNLKCEKLENFDQVTLTSEDVYTIFNLKGYSYTGDFQSIHSTNFERTKANIKWTDNWVPFLDSIFQFNALARDYDGISKPVVLKKLSIDVDMHKEAMKSVDKDQSVAAELYSLYEYTKCGGVQVKGLIFDDQPAFVPKQDIILTQEFIPHFLTGSVELKTALQVNLQIVAENVTNCDVKVTDVLSNKSSNVTNLLKNTTLEIPSVKYNLKSLGENTNFMSNQDVRTSDLLIVDDILGNEEKMKKLYNAVSGRTFILALEEDTTTIPPKYQLFDIITAITVQKQKMILLKKIDKLVDPNITYMPITSDLKFSWIAKLKAELMKPRSVVLVSERQPHCGLLGLVKKLRIEHGNKIGLVIIDDYDVPSFNPEKSIYRDQLKKNLAFNIMKKGQWGGYYYVSDNAVKDVQDLHLTTTSNDLESLIWTEQPSIAESNLKVKVCFAGPSLKDVQNATSKTNCHGNVYGMDFSGISKSGEKVMGVVAGGAMASTVEADPDLLWPVPGHWTLEDAATVPLPYILAYYIISKCHYKNLAMKRCSDVHIFVNGGAGALGQAVIAICLSSGYNVYTTVSDMAKKKFLLRLYPALDEKNVSHSVNNLFKDKVCSTAGRNVCDVVINCLSGEQRKAAIKCCGSLSMFLDLSEQDMLKNKNFEMGFLRGIKHYIAVRLDSIFRPEFAYLKKELQQKLAEGIADGVVRPLSRVVYSPVDVSSAFSHISSRKHRGRVLIDMDLLKSSGQDLKVAARMSYSAEGTYIVACDSNPVIGMELADRLVKQGARNLLINMTPNSLAGYCYTKLISWNEQNVNTKIYTENLKSEEECFNLLKEGAKLGPILGIFIVQNFSGTESLAPEDVAAKFNNTTGVVANLDFTSRNVCSELKHFVVINNDSQRASDEYMASVIDTICYARREIGLPALTFRIGSLKKVNDNPEKSRSSLSAIFDALETSMKSKHSSVTSLAVVENTTEKFLKGVSNILGVKDINMVDETMQVKNVLMNDVIANQIHCLINEIYKINISSEDIQEMTIANLKNLENTLSQMTTNAKDGLESFFTYIDSDEWKSAEPLVTMATTFSSIKEEEELDPKATYLMLVPGFECNHEVLSSVCERLKVQAVAFQYGPELTNADVTEIAANVMKYMKKRFQLNGKFYILGYSFGVNVALELAALYEKEGHVGIVYCLDSSPDALRAQFEAHVGHLSNSELQNNLVQHMFKLMGGKNSEEMMKKLQKIDSWDDKIELCVHGLRGIVSFSNQYKRCIIQGAYKRIMLTKEYQPNFKLQSQLVLIKGKPHPKMKQLEHDYGLSMYTKEPVQVFNLEADHASILHDCRVTNIINKFLEPKLLEAFKSKNLCWSYVDNPIKSW